MATYIKTLKDINEDVILPKTTSSAVLMSDGSTSLETQLDNIVSVVNTFAASNTAAIVNITDTGEYYTSDNVENALQEVGSTLTGKSNTGHTHTEADITDFGVYEPADPTILKDADIGVTVQEQLVNQTNIKSINGSSILGSGDIDISVEFTPTLSSASWTGSSVPYSYVASISGVLSTDVPEFIVTLSGTYATDILRKDEWSKVYGWVTSTDTITFYATEVPTIDLPLMVKVVR